LTTYDVDTLTFIEPEEPELPADEDAAEEPELTDNEQTNEAVEENNADGGVVAPTLDISDMLDDKDVAPLSNGVKIEIERPHNDLDDMINPEQLNLF
jgi:hypothetical protein